MLPQSLEQVAGVSFTLQTLSPQVPSLQSLEQFSSVSFNPQNESPQVPLSERQSEGQSYWLSK